MNIEDIAKVAHSVNKAFCESIGDLSQLDWDKAETWQRESAIAGVNFIMNNPNAGEDATHNSWLEEKRKTGWKYGPIKDPIKKEHPCFIEYNELPTEQKSKDYIFKAVVSSLLPYLGDVKQSESDRAFNKEIVGIAEQHGIVHSFGEDGKRTADLSNMTRKPV